MAKAFVPASGSVNPKHGRLVPRNVAATYRRACSPSACRQIGMRASWPMTRANGGIPDGPAPRRPRPPRPTRRRSPPLVGQAEPEQVGLTQGVPQLRRVSALRHAAQVVGPVVLAGDLADQPGPFDLPSSSQYEGFGSSSIAAYTRIIAGLTGTSANAASRRYPILMALQWRPGGADPPYPLCAMVPLPGDTLINVRTRTAFHAAVRVGDHLNMVERVNSITPEKRTRLGVGHFVTTVAEYRDQHGRMLAEHANTLLRFRRDTG